MQNLGGEKLKSGSVGWLFECPWAKQRQLELGARAVSTVCMLTVSCMQRSPPTATTPLVRTALTLQNLSSELYLAVAFLLLHHRSDCRRCFAQIAGESTRLAEPRGPHRGLARHRCSPHRTLQSDGGWSRGGSCGGARTPSGSFSPRPELTEGSPSTR